VFKILVIFILCFCVVFVLYNFYLFVALMRFMFLYSQQEVEFLTVATCDTYFQQNTFYVCVCVQNRVHMFLSVISCFC